MVSWLVDTEASCPFNSPPNPLICWRVQSHSARSCWIRKLRKNMREASLELQVHLGTTAQMSQIYLIVRNDSESWVPNGVSSASFFSHSCRLFEPCASAVMNPVGSRPNAIQDPDLYSRQSSIPHAARPCVRSDRTGLIGLPKLLPKTLNHLQLPHQGWLSRPRCIT